MLAQARARLDRAAGSSPDFADDTLCWLSPKPSQELKGKREELLTSFPLLICVSGEAKTMLCVWPARFLATLRRSRSDEHHWDRSGRSVRPPRCIYIDRSQATTIHHYEHGRIKNTVSPSNAYINLNFLLMASYFHLVSDDSVRL